MLHMLAEQLAFVCDYLQQRIGWNPFALEIPPSSLPRTVSMSYVREAVLQKGSREQGFDLEGCVSCDPCLKEMVRNPDGGSMYLMSRRSRSWFHERKVEVVYAVSLADR